MTKQELEEFKEEVRNAPKDYLLDMKKYFEQEYRLELHEIGGLEEHKYLFTYKMLKRNYIGYLIEYAKKLDIMNAELKRIERLEKMK